MKLFHISDLHIGKQLHLHDMAESQRKMLHQIVENAKREQPDGILIAGDIYDKSAPSGEAFSIFDEFLKEINELQPKIPVFLIAGNHDSQLRLQYASRFLEKEEIYISAMPPQSEEEWLKKITLEDTYGPVHIYLLPFVRPADGKNFFREEKDIRTYDDAVAAFLEREQIDTRERNVLVAHQFFTSGTVEPERRESEMRYISVGGIDNVSTSHVEDFDYVALGHIHTCQKIGHAHIRYSGTPLKYSVSEANDQKGITVVTLLEKGKEVELDFIPLVMEPDVKKVKGTLTDVIAMCDETLKEDYVSITLTDEETLFRPKDRLQEFYHHILEVNFENRRTKALLQKETVDVTQENPLELFADFYQEMNGQPMSEAEELVMKEILEKLG